VHGTGAPGSEGGLQNWTGGNTSTLRVDPTPSGMRRGRLGQIGCGLRPVYTAANEAEARARFAEFAEKGGKPYPSIKRLRQNAWTEFVPFLNYDVEIRKIICSRSAIESLNARYRRALRVRHFPTYKPR
jgi:transposase-like protein